MGLISLVDSYFRRTFLSAGLCPSSVSVSPQTTIHFWSPKSSESPKPYLLLLHGFGPTANWQWRNQVLPLSRHFHLIIPDLVFFGDSTTSSPLRSELFQAHSIIQLLDSAIGTHRRFHVAGTSYGGFVAYHVARILGPERVGKVVIASSDLLKQREDDVKLRERAGVEDVKDLMLPRDTGSLRKLMGLAVYKDFRFMPEFLLRDALNNLYGTNLKEKAELMKGITLGNRDEFQLTPLPQDVLIIWGDQDRIFPLEKAFELKKQLGDKVKLEIVKNTGHIPNAENPGRFNKALLNFLLDSPKPSMTGPFPRQGQETHRWIQSLTPRVRGMQGIFLLVSCIFVVVFTFWAWLPY